MKNFPEEKIVTGDDIRKKISKNKSEFHRTIKSIGGEIIEGIIIYEGSFHETMKKLKIYRKENRLGLSSKNGLSSK